MGVFLGWVLSALVVAGVGFGLVAVVTGRTPVMAEMPPDRVPGLSPVDGVIGPDAVAAARFDLAFRGYRMDQVDDLLDRLAAEIAARDEQIASLRRQVRTPSPQRGPERA